MNSEVKVPLSDFVQLFKKSTETTTLLLNLASLILTTPLWIETDSKRIAVLATAFPIILWMISIYVFTKKREVTSAIVQPERGNLPFTRKEQVYSSKIRRAALISIFLVPFLIAATFITNAYLRSRPSGKIVILVAEFEPPDQNHGLTEYLIEQLRKRTKKYSDVEVRQLGKAITPQEGSEKAREYGEEQKANLILWGWNRSLKESARTFAHVEILHGPKRLHLDDDVQELKAAAADVEQFKVQIELADEMSFLILQVLGIARFEARDYMGAINCLNEALALSSTPTDMTNRSDAFYIRGYSKRFLCELDGAISDYSESIKCHPSSNAYINRGNIYSETYDWGKAIQDYKKALELFPGSPAAHTNLATLAFKKREFDLAVIEASEVIKAGPSQCQYQGFQVRADAYYVLGKFEEAAQDYGELINLKPDTYCAYFNRAEALNQLGSYDKAIADCNKAISINPNCINAYNTRGKAFMLKGDYEMALREFSRAIRFPSDYADLFLNRTKVYLHLGEMDLAISDFQAVLQLSKDEKLRQIAVNELKNLGVSASDVPAK